MEKSESNSASLGGWTRSELEGTALQNAGLGVDAGLPDTARFIAGVAKLVRRRLATPGHELDSQQPAVFLLEPSAKIVPAGNSPKRAPMLNNGLTPINGRLWFVPAPVISGKFVEIDSVEDEALFALVSDTLGLGNVPAILFDPRTSRPAVRFYPLGLGDPDTYEPVDVVGGSVSLDQIFAVIDLIYEKCLVTPEAQAKGGSLWKEKTKFYPVKQAEDVVQAQLRVGLTTAFPTCTVRHEQTEPSGRLDIEIEEVDPLDNSQLTRHALLELKVLRSYGSTGDSVSDQETLDWVKSGVDQAYTYRESRKTRESALCCFDMRKTFSGETCFDHVRDLSKQLSVALKVWYIFNSSENYRDHRVARKLNSR